MQLFKNWLTICFLISSMIVKAQQLQIVDQLLNRSSVNNPLQYYKTADSLNEQYQTESAILILQKALSQVNPTTQSKEYALLNLELGDCLDDNQEYKKAVYHFRLALPYIVQHNNSDLQLENYVGIAGALTDIDSNHTALIYLHKALTVAETNQAKYKRYFNTIYNNLGLAYNSVSNFTEGLNYFFKAINYCEKNKDIKGLSITYNNLGILYSEIQEFDKSLLYYRKVLAIKPTSSAYANIGILYSDIHKYDSAMYYINKSIKLDKEKNDIAGLSSSYTVVGNLFKTMHQYDSAMYYYNLSTQLANQVEDVSVVQNNIYNTIELLISQGKYQQAKPLAESNLKSLLTGGDLDFIADAYSQLKDIYSKLGDYKKAYEYQSQYVIYKDSAEEANKTLEIKKIELGAEYKKKSLNDSLMHAQATLLNNMKHDEEIGKQRLLIIGFIIIIIIVAFFSIMVYKRYQISQRQREIIDKQKNEMYNQKLLVEEKQKEILDSIHYAKRIQYAIIAHQDFIDKHLPNNFVYFNPKDIVSGDFYWATKHNNKFYLAVCDSTGHGVPGAFMSLLNIGYLSEAINEKNISEPNEVFNYVRKRLVNTISKEGQKDGFDGVLICYDASTNSISYAAANNKPILVREQQVTELSFDRMPVGVSEKTEDFSLHTLQLQTNDILYLFTDGYADQFGGPKGKKFKYKSLNSLILNVSSQPLEQQKNTLQNNFTNWRGNLEQVDDVCVIGIKF